MQQKLLLGLLCVAAIITACVAGYRWRHAKRLAIIETWAPRLVDADRALRQQALQELSDVGPICIPAVLELLDDNLQQSRRWGARTYLKDVGHAHHFCYEMPELFILAARLVKSSRAAGQLIGALEAGQKETDELKEQWCSWALQEGIVSVPPELYIGAWPDLDEAEAQKLRHPDFVVRRWVALEYVYRSNPAYLDQAMSDDDHLVRLFSVAKCLHIINESTTQAVNAGLGDESPLVRAAALDVLYERATGFGVEISREVIPKLQDLVRDNSQLVRWRALLLASTLEQNPEERAIFLDRAHSEAEESDTLDAEATMFAQAGYLFLPKRERAIFSEAFGEPTDVEVPEGL